MRKLVLIGIAALCLGCPPGKDSGAPDAMADAQGARTDGGALGDAAPFKEDASAWDEGNIPPAQSEELVRRMQHLLEAIAQDNSDLAKDALYPRDAFIATRDTHDPGRVWDTKISASFRKAVHRAHKKKKHMDKARFVSFELGRQITSQPPKHHEFKKTVWRVKRSKIAFSIDDHTYTMEIAEMVSHRGAWYVTRLR